MTAARFLGIDKLEAENEKLRAENKRLKSALLRRKEMTAWHEKLTDEEIQKLKKNDTPYGLCEDWMQVAFNRIREDGCLERFDGFDWVPDRVSGVRVGEFAYRLSPDWTRPKKPEPEPEPEWEVCKVEIHPGNWRGKCFFTFNRIDYSLEEALALPGFDGVEFEEWPKKKYAYVNMWVGVDGQQRYFPGKNRKPATPHKVYFRK